MPIYAYRCESCGVQFERKQSFDDAALKVCPECRKRTLKRVISPVGIVFKGAGFYSTDHRASTSASSATKKDDKKEDNKGDKKEEKKESPKDAKPAKESKPVEKA